MPAEMPECRQTAHRGIMDMRPKDSKRKSERPREHPAAVASRMHNHKEDKFSYH